MSRKTVIAGNWKMNKLASEVPAFASELKAALTGSYDCDIVICAPYPLIPALNENAAVVGMGVGAEDVSAFEKGTASAVSTTTRRILPSTPRPRRCLPTASSRSSAWARA